MIETNFQFDQLYLAHHWAYGCEPDLQLLDAVDSVAKGRLVDLGGGQGRLSLALAQMGFDVEVVDSSHFALEQVASAATAQDLTLRCTRADVRSFRPAPGLQAAVAALLFHLPARFVSLDAARTLGAALNSGGLFYLSMPGYNAEMVELAHELLDEARCTDRTVIDHLVTRQERPRLPVARRYETRAFGFRV